LPPAIQSSTTARDKQNRHLFILSKEVINCRTHPTPFRTLKTGFFFIFVSFCFCFAVAVILLRMPSETDKMKRAGTPAYGNNKKGADEVTVSHFATTAQREKYLKEEGALPS